VSRLVRQRANGRCEYCRIHESDAAKRHHVDHIRARKHDGTDDDTNLCLCCAICNRYKGTDLTSIDPQTDDVMRLFNPRRDKWEDHFRLNGEVIEALTPQARTTIRLLKLNALERLEERQRLIKLGRYP
jgi:hypothetical protein